MSEICSRCLMPLNGPSIYCRGTYHPEPPLRMFPSLLNRAAKEVVSGHRLNRSEEEMERRWRRFDALWTKALTPER